MSVLNEVATLWRLIYSILILSIDRVCPPRCHGCDSLPIKAPIDAHVLLDVTINEVMTKATTVPRRVWHLSTNSSTQANKWHTMRVPTCMHGYLDCLYHVAAQLLQTFQSHNIGCEVSEATLAVHVAVPSEATCKIK